ncbi:hypothetical protein EBAPG3_002660 [Nitrosospira lacus]|uniref:Uncharacterized protein n=1 Tax=Nitrosospira lacus TaxID=1288494 RepID=A0A1W6SLU0_9PROT|nr:hypothetical protein EBAPG3_002660 [Nitrosospira lacus]
MEEFLHPDIFIWASYFIYAQFSDFWRRYNNFSIAAALNKIENYTILEQVGLHLVRSISSEDVADLPLS